MTKESITLLNYSFSAELKNPYQLAGFHDRILTKFSVLIKLNQELVQFFRFLGEVVKSAKVGSWYLRLGLFFFGRNDFYLFCSGGQIIFWRFFV